MRHEALITLLLIPSLVFGQVERSPATVSPEVRSAVGLGARVRANHAARVIAPIVVIVPDEASYLAAIGMWGEFGPFPVLVDDTSLAGRQDIARFVRAFEPREVVRYKGGFAPGGLAEREALLRLTVYEAWGAKDEKGFAEKLSSRGGGVPPGPIGVVATAVNDDARAAAVALAAYHGQLLTFVAHVPAPNADAPLKDIDKLQDEITTALARTGLPWDKLGDAIDSVTLCMNMPMKAVVGSDPPAPATGIKDLQAKPGEYLAVTDLVGRSSKGSRADRWAWCGQVVGNFRQSAYRSMGAIFLQPKSAFVFDGYEPGGQFGLFDGTKAGLTLTKAGVLATTIDAPHNSIDDWRLATAGAFATASRRGRGLPPPPSIGGLDADLIAVNTMGNSDFFQLRPGNGKPGDVPVLQRPALTHFVHSWSLQHSADPWAIGGRWLDHGCFAYVGSVHEPFLGAFVPTPDFCGRLTDKLGAPLGAAARVVEPPFNLPWRVAVIGDPLYAVGPALPRRATTPSIEGATPVRDEVRTFAKNREYAAALDALMVLARDEDAGKLAAAAIAEDASRIDTDAALRGVLAAFYAGDLATLTAMGLKIDKPGDRDFLVADCIWQALWPSLDALNADQITLLSRTLRPYQYAQDALLAARGIARTPSLGGPDAARAFFENAKNKAWREDIKRDMGTMVGQFGK